MVTFNSVQRLVTWLFDELSHCTLKEIRNNIFHAKYFPFFFVIECMRVCTYLRVSCSRPGLAWWRSFGLGFILVYGQRLLFSWLTNARFDDIQMSILREYTVVWAVFNIMPFDIVFRVVNRRIPRFLIAALAEFGFGQFLVNWIWFSANTFKEKPLAAATVLAVLPVVIAVIEALDNAVFASKRRFPYFPRARIVRQIAAVMIDIVICVPNGIVQDPLTLMYPTAPVVGVLFAVLKILDTGIYRNTFMYADVLLPKPLVRLLCSFHPERKS